MAEDTPDGWTPVAGPEDGWTPVAAPSGAAPAAPQGGPDGWTPVAGPSVAVGYDDVSRKADAFLRDHPLRPMTLEATSVPNQELAQAGTVGQAVDNNSKTRELEDIRNQTVAGMGAKIRQMYMDMTAANLPDDVQREAINRQIAMWEQQGLPAGKYNPADPKAFSNPDDPNSLRSAMTKYYDTLRQYGAAKAQAPVMAALPGGKMAVATPPSAIEAAGLSLAEHLPGSGGAALGGIAGEGLGAATGIPGAGFVGGIAGSLAGGYAGEKALREYVEQHGTEQQKNLLASFDAAHAMGQQTHPLADWLGMAGSQALSMGSGIREGIAGGLPGVAKSITPRLAGAGLGAGIEAATEAGSGQDLDPYQIGQAAITGGIFIKPRFMGEGHVPMSFEGRNWTDTNVPIDQLHATVLDGFNAGANPAEVAARLGKSLPNTPENAQALRMVSADIRHGRDPSESLAALNFRPQGLTQAEAVDVANQHTAGWQDAPNVHVHDNYDSATIPQEMKGQVGPGVLGWKDEQGDIHLIASQHQDADSVTSTMFHEAMHVGLVRAYQGGLQDKLVDLYDNAQPNLQAALKAKVNELANTDPRFKDMTESERKALVVDEVLANASENGVPSEAFDKVKAYIRNFGRTHLGEFGKKISYSDSEVRQILSKGYDAVSKGSGDSAGPLRYLNFGMKSKDADMETLKEHALKGDLTHTPQYPGGWFRGRADYEPRYEVSDRHSTVDMTPVQEKGEAKLPDVLDHPDLYDAYPHMAKVKVKYETDPMNSGSWDRRENTIYVSKDARDPHGTILHEVQHAIQDHEGWARGANADVTHVTAPIEDVRSALLHTSAGYLKRAESMATEYHNTEQIGKQHNIDVSSHLDQYAKDHNDAAIAHEKLRQAAIHGDEWDARIAAKEDANVRHLLYQRAGGEYEARAAASRRKMGEYERFENPQFQKKDQAGVEPTDIYKPNPIRAQTSERAAEMHFNPEDIHVDPFIDENYNGKFRNVTITDHEGNLKSVGKVHIDSNDGRPTAVVMRDPVSGELHDTSIATNDAIRRKSYDIPDTWRFSRKYSGQYKNDYLGREKRTEDLLKGHFGNFSINNLKGMMRPLEEYNRVSHEEIMQAAQQLKDQGFDAGVAAAQGAIPDNSGFVVALRDLVREKLESASEVAGRYRQSGGMRHERELMRAVTDLGQVMAVFDKTASNLGRMLHSLRLRLDSTPDEGLSALLSSVRFANGSIDPEQMDKIAQALISGDPTAIRKSIDRFDPAWKKYGKSLFYNQILGSPSVQIGNILGNATNIVKAGIQDVAGYGLGKAVDVAKTNANKIGFDFKPTDRMHFDELVGRAQGLLAGLLNQATYNGHKAWNTAAKEFFIKAGQQEHENKFASQAIENTPLSLGLEYGTRGLQAADAFFRTALEHSAMQGLATREARRLNNGEAPTLSQIADVMASPTREMLSKVEAEADRLLFQENPFSTAESFSRMMRSIPGGWLIAPIIRTPANIGRTAFETFDPTGRVTARNKAALKAGGPEAYRVRGAQMLATALWAGAVYLLNNDDIHGGGPSNPAARADWLMKYQPYTLGKGQDAIPLRGISPIGDGLSIIADAHDAWKYGIKNDQASMADKALMVAAGLGDAFLSNSFASSVTDNLERGMKPTIQNLLGTVVTSAASVPLYSQYKKAKDPFVRDTTMSGDFGQWLADKAATQDNSLMEHYFGNVKPRDELPIRHTPFGEPIMADAPTSTDPVSQEVGRLVGSTGQAVVPAFSRSVKGQHVPNDIYESFLAFAGPLMREGVQEIMNDPAYRKALTDDQRSALIRSNKNLKGLHARLSKQLQQMMSDRNPLFEQNSVNKDLQTIATIPGE